MAHLFPSFRILTPSLDLQPESNLTSSSPTSYTAASALASAEPLTYGAVWWPGKLVSLIQWWQNVDLKLFELDFGF